MTYIIKRNGKRFNRLSFASYEQARSYIRKWLRKKGDSVVQFKVHCFPDNSLVNHRNPSHSDYGFKVEKRDTERATA